MKKVILSAFACCLYLFSHGQVAIMEKDHEISRKSNKGYLGAVQETSNGQFDMIYILPSSKRKIKTEIYHFDKDANQIGVDRTEEDVELARKRWKWFTFKGDFFMTNNVSASTNYTGDLVFRRKRITAKWNWWTGQYERDVDMLDKLKPRTESGRKYKFTGGAYEVERDSTILVLATDLQASMDNNKTVFDLLKADNQLNIKVMQRIEFPYSVQLVYAQPLTDEQSENIPNDDLPRDWALVYAPVDLGGKWAKSKDTRTFEYLRITPEGNIKERFTFQAPYSGWRILDAYEKDNAVLLYGLGTGKADKYLNKSITSALIATTSNDATEQAEATKSAGGMLGGFKTVANMASGQNEVGVTQDKIDEQLDLLTYNSFVMAKLQNGGAIMSKVTSIDEMNEKATCPPDMKRPSKFDGKMFKVSGVDFLSDNSLIMSLQDFKKNKSGGHQNKLMGTIMGYSASQSASASQYLFKDVFLLHFNKEGDLVKNYTVTIDQKNKKGFFNNSPLTADMFPAKSYVYESPDKKKLTWVMHMVKAIDKSSSSDFNPFNGRSSTTTYFSPLFSIEYGSIDLEKNKASDFKTLGEDEKRKFYLYPRNNMMSTTEHLYFFSETTKGDKMLISRFNRE
ncbi:hypothetical protein GXP67_25580 [Rhodocytophaga rosea]|uniref:Uncharacterized protein n=1 Tax=Rhodocytophaga rosea TaxID=2704465 RepID=A0A6C0GP14_9BACT|nr:hypothetical protein [Rhodocytophaga rosea]QHT69775.1 hypothetical protein GXP67_25580 [Rhodocytophaga rosea]